jgi:hypothetical protein
MKKTADCVRQAANWSKIQPYHRFDKRAFDADRTKADLPHASPKLVALFQTIDELDTKDMKEHGHLFKHMIFSDVKTQGYGAKIVASAFKAKGYHLIFDQRFEVNILPNTTKNFAVLSSTPLFERPVTVKLRNEILQAFNGRPDNIHGDKLRFIILDQGYKEGIDLFDIKYIHILEPLTTPGDEKQAIGRGTRFCGQKGLTFHPQKGWPLHVFRYDVAIPEELHTEYRGVTTLSELHMGLMGIDTRKMVLASELERYAILGSADHSLTKNIHGFRLEGAASGNVHTLSPRVKEHLIEQEPEPSKSAPVESVEIYGKKFSRAEAIRCAAGCKGLLPFPTPLLMLVWVGASNDPTPLYYRHPRHVLCKAFENDRKYCRLVNIAWRSPSEFLEKYEARIRVGIERLSADPKVIKQHIQKMHSYAKSYNHINLAKKEPSHKPPLTKLSYWKLQKHIQQEFSDLTWESIQVENLCVPKGGTTESRIVDFTPTQNFVRHFLCPSSPYKGMFAYHSVGTGKLCTAIATATTSFEKEGYTILYVTRHTLKADVWKNVFGQVCSIAIQERVRQGDHIPQGKKERMAMLSSSWMEPVSYRQFTNMLKGKNKLYDELVQRNGSEDPLRKTFVVIDEAHKLFAADMGNERPDMATLSERVQHSYDVSKENSVRLLLMTATPMGQDPLDLIKILNLLREKRDEIPIEYEAFVQAYLDDHGRFTPNGAAQFLNQVAGYISYLNRESDIRQFAYPIIQDVTVPLTVSSATHLQNDLEAETRELERLNVIIDDMGKGLVRHVRSEYDGLLEKCKRAPSKDAKAQCNARAKAWWDSTRANIEEHKGQEKAKRDAAKNRIRNIKRQMQHAEKNDISQHSIIQKVCLSNRR